MKRLALFAAGIMLLAGCAGSTPGAAPAPRPTAVNASPTAAPGPPVHIVQRGDTLTSIATTYEVDPAALAAANALVDPSLLEVGQTLVLPASSSGTPPVTVTSAATEPPARPPLIERPPEPRQGVLGVYDEVRSREGGPLLLGAMGVLAGLLVVQLLAWGLYQLRIWLMRRVPVLLRGVARGIRGLVREVWYALGWIAFVFWWPSRWALRRALAPPLRALRGLFALAHAALVRWARANAPRLRARAAALARLGGRVALRLGRAFAARARVAALRLTLRALDEASRVVQSRPGLTELRDAVTRRLRPPLQAARSLRPTGPAERWPPSEEMLLDALAADELRVDFRPVIELSEGRIEALTRALRWDHPALGDVREQRLVAAIEQEGFQRLQRAVLRAILDEACRVLVSAHAAGHSSLRVLVPLLPSQFADPGLPLALDGALASSGAPAGSLELGIDERSARADLDAARGALERLRHLGIRTTLLNFGALTAEDVRRLGVDVVSIDFWGAARTLRARSFVTDAVAAARRMELPVLATGVETPEEVALVAELGCTLVQGDAFGEPRPASELLERPMVEVAA